MESATNLTPHFSEMRVERVIGSVRVALAMSSLFAVWMDPAEPGRVAELTYALHGAYLAYALVVAAITWRRDSTGRLPIVIHFGDIGVASVLQYLTLGPSSPFFIFSVFTLFSAALRWGWRETVRTAVVVLIAFIATGIWLSRTLGPSEFELNRFIIRIAYFVVMTVVLVYLGQHEERLRERVQQLARWPLALGRGLHAVVPELLHHTSRIVGADHASVVWWTDDEPWVYRARWPRGREAIERHPPADFEPIVHDDLEAATFVFGGSATASAPVDVKRAGQMTAWRGARPVHNGLIDVAEGRVVVSAPFHADHLSGRVFFTVPGTASADLLPIAEVIGREMGYSIGHLSTFDRSRQLAVAEDRIRVARDLHDGVLQSLTGIRLELESLATGGASGPESSVRLRAIERALALEQQDLRRFIEDLKPSVAEAPRTRLAERLNMLQGRLALQWPIPITVRVDPPDLFVTEELARAVPLMVHEAIVNAVRHAKPSRVSVDVTCAAGSLSVVVTDDGKGFAFSGRRDQPELEAANAGPVSLRERVTSLGGRIAVESSAAGSRVELSMPFAAPYA